MKNFLNCYDGVLYIDNFSLSEEEKKISSDTKEYTVTLKTDEDMDQVCLGFIDDPEVNIDDCFILVPSAVYDGNRFLCKYIYYPPSIPLELRSKEGITICNDVPRLKDDGNNLLEIRMGTGASPMVALWEKSSSKGIIYTYSPLSDGTPYTESGFYLTNRGQFKFCYPIVRKRRYRFSLDWEIGGDRYAKVKKGETVEFKVKKTEFNCNSMEEFYEKVLNTRYSSGRKTQQMGLPLNEAFNTIKDKFNVHNWIEKIGVYRTYPNSDEMVFSAGWCGGGFVPYIFRHLNENTDSESINRAKRYMDYIYSNTQTSSGLFQCCMDEDGNVMGDDFYDRNNIYIHLIRRSADILYYHAALFNYMKKNNSPIPEKWHNGLRKCADAFLKLWNENKDLGFLVNNETLEIVAGGSHSGSMAIAGLALASVYYENNDYLTAAKEIADKYYERFINQGYTTGGPAEAMTAPDSESAYALLEGLVTVYEITENDKYLKFAEYTAAYVSTWVIDYDYHYPKTCLFGKTDKKTTGAVWANLQNKHGAPGFATHSGSAYLRLYIYTGKEIYLNIIADVARAITQFTAHPDNRLFDYLGVELPSGFMCERVNTCDWEDFVFIGSLFYGSNWCEYSAMMCYTDLPGIVWDKTKNTVTLLDRMEAVIENGRLKITNPTKYDCTVKVLVLNGEKEVLSCELNDKFTAVSVASGQSVII